MTARSGWGGSVRVGLGGSSGVGWDRVGTCRVESGRAGSGRVGAGRAGSGLVGRVGARRGPTSAGRGRGRAVLAGRAQPVVEGRSLGRLQLPVEPQEMHGCGHRGHTQRSARLRTPERPAATPQSRSARRGGDVLKQPATKHPHPSKMPNKQKQALVAHTHLCGTEIQKAECSQLRAEPLSRLSRCGGHISGNKTLAASTSSQFKL